MSSGVYVPRAKLLALQAEAEQTQNGSLATPPPTPAETATTSYSEEEIASWPEARRYFYNSSNTFRELQNAKKAFNENPDVEEMWVVCCDSLVMTAEVNEPLLVQVLQEQSSQFGSTYLENLRRPVLCELWAFTHHSPRQSDINPISRLV